ncbi:chromate transporter [Deinococcus piscis]|uniref:Chromate transporter n=1 Tax=Deinococcus piscis TaxID=394230 RepID=A0ABQ3K7Z3_9DEIO|nr:chromate efflux transporter [Deinococcus piscis]GHG07340.1 chromate transporter [Deinococcus piscis]
MRELLTVFLRLGLTSFGGPAAHLGYFQTEFVERRRWLSAAQFADLVALAQFLPGPSSSQVNLSIGYLRAGLPGALLAWAGFTLPSVLLLVALALWMGEWPDPEAGWLAGLKVAAAAVVAHAAVSMWRSLIQGAVQAGLALGTATLLLAGAQFGGTGLGAGMQVLALLLCAGVGWATLAAPAAPAQPLQLGPAPRTGAGLLLLAAGLLVLLPLLRPLGPAWELLDQTYRAGALVFGGGHVVLPLLEAGLVPAWVDHGRFVAGYGAANAVPGPLFTFASYLGAAQHRLPALEGVLIATLGIFLPGALLMLGALPFWSHLAAQDWARRALLGLNAGVVGLLLAALYDPVFRAGVTGPLHLALALLAYALLSAGKAPAWAVVLACAGAGWLLL